MTTSDAICTASGIQFFPLDPNPDDVRIEDIAHHLNKQCRWGGACARFYSVAEHCVRVSNLLGDGPMALHGLLHDAAEAYLVDLPAPIKPRMPEYTAAEDKLLPVIYDGLNLDPMTLQDRDVQARVRVADLYMREWERRDLMPATDWWSAPSIDEKETLAAWSFEPQTWFIHRYRMLTDKGFLAATQANDSKRDA